MKTGKTYANVGKKMATAVVPAFWKNDDSQDLFRAILSLKDAEEAQRFFRDLLTEKEIKEFSNRWKVARMLDKGFKYDDIENRVHMSSTTIARIHHWLQAGMGGYRIAIQRIKSK
jgi:TrpR-related protein YerC/YecD